MTIAKQPFASILRQIAAVAAVVIGALQTTNVIPGSYGWVLTAIGGIVLAVEHYVSDPSTGTTPAAPTPTVVTATNTVSPSVATVTTSTMGPQV